MTGKWAKDAGGREQHERHCDTAVGHIGAPGALRDIP